MNYWIQNAPHGHGPFPHALLDLGYLTDRASRDRCDRLTAAGIGQGNIQLAVGRRLLLRIPPLKLAKILKQFPKIKQKITYGITPETKRCSPGTISQRSIKSHLYFPTTVAQSSKEFRFYLVKIQLRYSLEFGNNGAQAFSQKSFMER